MGDSNGNRTLNCVPSEPVLKSILPLCRSTAILWLITRPSPVPEPPLVVKKGTVKMCGRARPGFLCHCPRSQREKTAVVARADIDAICSADGVNRIVDELRPDLV